ncbi:hypothetical protein [Clostridium sp. Cult2]|uniref:hypothetical protein n=1 Tax=Clostridium sp. Cult2 TaxID=2079003 RepID=UPI001F24BCCD|nr:hypothetical protein [Clostridium sp. Cult2]MCF6466213.1 hypothetical protein [Clostridium sp. Cult2]
MGFKQIVTGIGLKFLGKGLVSCSKIEKMIQKELEFYEDGFTIELKVFNTDTKVAVEKVGDKLKYLGSKYTKTPDLSIAFKSYEAALLMILGQIGVYEGYAQHRFIVKGDLIASMPFIRILYYVEAYLFPRFISKKILKEIPELSSPKVKAYIRLIA